MLAGEVPHRDFGELYTGSLTYAHALAFFIGGEDLLSLRAMLLVAFADCPEVYFLTGLPNPTSALFDFLDEPTRHSGRIRQLAADETVRVAVLTLFPDFSGPVPAEVSALLRRRFPYSERVGDYEVRWR